MTDVFEQPNKQLNDPGKNRQNIYLYHKTDNNHEKLWLVNELIIVTRK